MDCTTRSNDKDPGIRALRRSQPHCLNQNSKPNYEAEGGQENKILNFLKKPSEVTIVRRVYNRQSSSALFKKYNATVENFT